MDFPHMDDNQFPYIDTVKPYQFVNNFDYSRWDNSYITLKMLNVKWDNSLSNVPYFKNDTERNGWFTAKQGHIITLQSKFMITPESTVKVPVPYNEAYLFNYLMITMTNSNETYALDYGSEPGTPVGRWFYFIVDMKQLSPSTTELYLQLDYWTTFINSVNIPYMVLERGHAPMAFTDVDTYLADPINNNEYLLAKDFDFGNDSKVVKSTSFFPVGSGDKYVLFALPISNANFQTLVTATGTGSSSGPTYSDEQSGGTTTRWGEDLLVNDYVWDFGNAQTFATADLPVETLFNLGATVFNGYNVLAVKSTVASSFFGYLATHGAYILNAIDGVYIVADDCITVTKLATWNNYDVYTVVPKSTSVDFTLSKAAFSYDEKYSEIAKLYTYPYASIEITDNYGNVAEVRVENISGNASFTKTCSIMFPFIQYRCFFNGLNGDGTAITYTWKQLDGTSGTGSVWEDDFSRYMFDWDIPTYKLFANKAWEYATNNHSGVQAKRQAAIVEYQTADRYANTTEANVVASQTTLRDNTQRTAATDKDNTYRLSDTTVTNMVRSNEMNDRINGDDTSLVPPAWSPVGGLNPSLININNSARQLAAQNSVDNGNRKANRVRNANNALIEEGVNKTDMGFYSSFASTSIQAGSSVAGAGHVALSRAAEGAAVGAVIGGGAGAVAGAAISAGAAVISSAMSNALSYQSTRNYADAQEDYNDEMYNIDYETGVPGGYMRAEFKNQFDMSKSISTDTYTAQILATNETIDCNNTTTRNMYDTTSSPLGTIPKNALDTKDTIDTNSTNTCNTETGNAGWTRDATWQAANANLILRQMQAQAEFNNARLQKPANYGAYSGNAYPDVYEQRGIQWKIRTQSKSAIAQAGDGMLRYGYTVHRVWDISNKDFCKMENFTFWKAEDIWITNNDKTADRVVDVLSRAFLDGLTVWSDPDNIGGSSIYDNEPLEVNNE